MYKALLKYYSNLSIANKLQFMGIYTAIIAGSLSITFVFMYQYTNKKSFLETETITLSKIVSENITPAIIFNDSKFINDALESLKYKSRIKHAYALDNNSIVLASYHRDEVEIKEEILKKLNKFQEHMWEGLNLYTVVAIKDDTHKLASLVVVSSMEEILIGIVKEMLVIIALVGLSIIFSFRFRVVLKDSILEPIAHLNSRTHEIVKTGDLKENVKVYNSDEIGELAENFNYMMNTIRLSKEKLQTNNEELETRVNERTNDLNELNRDLDRKVQEETHKRAQQEQILIQQSRFAAMGEMIGNIAHQWRQPLNALGLLLQNIENAYEMDMLDEAYIKRSVEKGNRLTNSMSQTIDDFRNFFKPDKEHTVFSIASSIKNTLEMLGSSLRNNMININEEIDESICVKGIPSELSQVVLNVLNNAKDALLDNRSDGRQINIKVFKDESSAYLEIEDNAGGIPKEILDKIFDPYFTTKDEGKGTGIGLYMSKTIVESNMKGSMGVQNSEDGAKFIIKIKLEEDEGFIS